ncbi:MYB family transcription factor [Klebsormidium nitens]|uniref:MYB family transcription factor n=1 Tax=Klebsormidium nitens TaxID=105231 RepID=A0A1Y1IG41_KLENI|nr:MYB family transcription factor [Klebsormidium nitens]|eukprot:GAQ89815.1 MYB family transcription factor [Klebsormidium nitens]
MADRWPQQDGRPDLPRTESGSDAGSDTHPKASDDPIQSPLASASSGGRARGLAELPAVREVLLGTIDRPSPDLQALYQASGTSVDELLEQKKAIDCLASASLINAGVQRQKKGDSDPGRKRSRSKAEEGHGGQEGGADLNDSGSEKPSKTTTIWTEDEDKLLYELVARFGTSKWSLVASKFENKTNKQCRRRWQTCSNVMGAKGAWTAEEDNQLIEGHAFFGNRWTDIAKLVPGRTDNAAKNRYFALLRKQAASAKAGKPSEEEGGSGLAVLSEDQQVDPRIASAILQASPGARSELPGQKRNRPSDDFSAEEVEERVSPRFRGGAAEPSLGRLQGLFFPLEAGLEPGPQFGQGLNLNLPEARFLQQQKGAQEFRFRRPEGPQPGISFSRPEELPGYFPPREGLRQPHVDAAPLPVIPRPDGAEGGAAGEGGDARQPRQEASRKESLDLDLNSTPLKWL